MKLSFLTQKLRHAPALVEKFKDLLLVVEFAAEYDRNLVPEAKSLFFVISTVLYSIYSINLSKNEQGW